MSINDPIPNQPVQPVQPVTPVAPAVKPVSTGINPYLYGLTHGKYDYGWIAKNDLAMYNYYKSLNPNKQYATFWENPQTIVRYRNLLRTAPPDWQPPDWLQADYISELYDYLKEKNKDVEPYAWKPLPTDDPGAIVMRNMATPPVEFLLPNEYKYSLGNGTQSVTGQPLTDAQVAAQQPIDWSDLDNPEYKWMKTYLSLFSPQAEGIENRPELSKLSASAVQSIMLGLGAGVAVGSFTGPVGGVIAGLAAAGLLTYQSYTGNKVPLLNDLMRPFNWLAEGAEATIGMANLAKQEGFDEVFDSLESAYRTGLLEYETWKASNIPNWIAGIDDALRPNVDITTAGKNQVWKISQGNLKPVEAPYGKGGEALAHYHKWIESGQANDEYQAALETGYDGRYQEFIYQKVMEDYGDTAIANDIVWQTVIDPLNVLPWAIGKTGGAIAGKVASAADNVTTARIAGQIEGAFKQGTGNILIDALPPGIQQIAEAVTGAQSSKGLLQTYQLYKDWIRTGFIPDRLKSQSPDIRAKYNDLIKSGVKQTDIDILDDTLTWTGKDGVRQSWQGKQGAKITAPTWDDLSAFEKYVGGLDEEYGFKELRPTIGKSFIQKLSKLTPEAQTNAILNIFHHNVASLMDAAGGDPVKMTELIERMAGKVEMKKGDAYADIINSPANKAVQAAMQYALREGDFVTNMLSSWTMAKERRMMLTKIATALNEKIGDVLQMAKDQPDVLAQRMNKIAPELKTTPDVLQETLKVFMGDDAMPWNAEQFQANLVNTFAQKMDQFFVDRYGLKPDSKIFRISNALKGVQSLILLGFNPAYLMNNWVNNLVTRAVDGVGGYMSPAQVNDFYTRFGIFPKDSGLTGFDEITGRVIREAVQAKDMIAKAQKGISYLNKFGVFSRLSGRIEKLEGGQARVIAMKDFMGKTGKVGEGIRRMPLVLENALDAKYPGMKEKVYAAINAGLNMKEIENSLFSTEVRPHIENMIDQLDKRYSTGGKGSMRELFDKLNLTDNLRDELMNAKTDMEIDLAFKNVEDRLTDWIEKAHVEDLTNRAKEVKNMVQSEKIPAVLQLFGDMVIEHARNWISTRIEWDRLYSWRDNGQITDAQFKKLANELNARHIAQMRRFNEYQTQTYKGIIQGLGIETDSTRGFVIKLGELQKIWDGFWTERQSILKRYFSQGEDKKFTWKQVEDALEDAYDRATKAEHKIQADMDEMFANGYADFTGWDATKARDWRARLLGMRDEMVEMQKAMRSKVKGMNTDAEKAMEYALFNEKYNQFIAAMKQFEHDGAYELMNKPVPQAEIPIPEVKNPAVDEMIVNEAKSLLKNQGVTDKQVNELLPDQDKGEVEPLPEAIKPVEKPVVEVSQPKAQIEKAKTIITAKIVAEDVFLKADADLRERMLHRQGLISRREYIESLRKSFPNESEEHITAYIALNDMMIDQWAVRNGYVPSEAVRDMWYATRARAWETGTGEIGAKELQAHKGSYQLMDDSRALLRAFESADFSTMVHETFHIWRRDLSPADMDAVAKLGGLRDAAELQALEARFASGDLKPGDPDYQRYAAAEENFARGAEQYITSGDAPTPALKSLFRKFTDWMLSIYKALTRKNGRVTGYKNTPLNVNINTKVNGISLKDIFDRMLTDQVERPKSLTDMIRERFEELQPKNRGKLSDLDLTTRARKDVLKKIIGGYADENEVRKTIDSMSDYIRLDDGSLLDDVTLYDALDELANYPDATPWGAKAPEARGIATHSYGVADHETKYPLTFKVIELDDLIASDNIQGDNLIANPNFNQDIQNRLTAGKTGETSNRMPQIQDIASKLNPEELLYDTRDTQRGSPIVSTDNMVASGNGRVAAFQYARDNYPDKWAEYQAELPKYAAQAGISPEQYAGMKNPVLVRELDPSVDLVEFANDANKPAVAVMTPVEVALNDANNITPVMLKKLNVLEDEDIYTALKDNRNSGFVNEFMKTLTANEKNGLTTKNEINQIGLDRIVNALIAKVYKSEDGQVILEMFKNNPENNIKIVQSAIFASLPQMAMVEGLIQYKMRSPDLSIADDVAWAARKISALRDSGMSAGEYMGQMGLFGESPAANMTPVQKLLLPLFEAKAPKKIREALRNYAGLVERQPATGQTTTAELVRTKEDLLNEAINGRPIESAEQGNLLESRPDAGTARPVLDDELARPSTEGEVQPIPGEKENIPGMAETVQGAQGEQPAVKQPWEMTSREYLQTVFDENNLGDINKIDKTPAGSKERQVSVDAIERYWQSVDDAVRARNEKAIAMYPDIAKNYEGVFKFKDEQKVLKTTPWQLTLNRYKELYGIKGKQYKTDSLGFAESEEFTQYTKREQGLIDAHKTAVQQALSEGKPVPPEVLADYPDLVAKQAVAVEAKAEYDAGQQIPIDRAQDIDLTHEEVLPVPEEVQKVIDSADTFKFEKKADSKEYLAWILGGEKGPRPNVSQDVINFFEPQLDTLREQAAQQASGIPTVEVPDVVNKGIEIQKAYKFTHGDTPCVANVYKDGKLIAYLPEAKLPDMRLDENTRILGLDPQFPDKVVYEQDGVIKSVDMRKPEVDKGQGALFQNAETRTDTPEFKAWFGKSKVVDAEGNPLTVYHGTDQSFSQFDGEYQFFTDDTANASEYSNRITPNAPHTPNVIPVYLSIQKPKRLSFFAVHDDILKIKASGKYDGVIVSNIGNGTKTFYITFKPEQSKSKFNSGDWNSNNPNMLYQSGQTDFFSQTADDLPLFSGTPMRAEDQAFRPRETGGQPSMFPDIVPEVKPTRIIEIAIKEKGATSYLRFDIRKTKAIRDTLALHKGEEMTARILDANGKVVESNIDPNQIINPTFGSNALFQDTQTATKDWYFSQLGKVLEGMPNKMTPEALRGFLNGKVKPSEMEWTGMDKWISQQEGQVTKQDALDYIAENQVRVEEVVKGGGPKKITWKYDGAEYSHTTPEGESFYIVPEIDGYTLYDDNGEIAFYKTLAEAKTRATGEVLGETPKTKFSDYTLPGGENYRELLMTLPVKVSKIRNPTLEEYARFYGADTTDVGIRQDYAHDLTIGRWSAKLLKEIGVGPESNNYSSPHWSEPNVLAHIRFDDRIDADGKRVLFIEEVQSDWHQAGREKGYDKKIPNPQTKEEFYQYYKINETKNQWIIKQKDNDRTVIWYPKNEIAGLDTIEGVEKIAIQELPGLQVGTGGVPPAPFSKNWEELAIKRAIRYAAENGYERVAWTTGKMQADRYNLAKQVDRLEWYKFGSAADEWGLTGVKDGKQILHEVISESKLPDYVGKDIAAKLIAKEKTGTYDNGNEYSYVEGEADLSVGGEGMKGFYDIKLPEIIKKYIKKWGATVGETDIRAGDNREVQYTNGVISGMTENTALTRVQSFDITPEMRDAVVYQGQPLFQDGFAEQPGGVEQFREYNEQPIDVQRMSDAPMGEVPLNGTPVTEPFSRTLDEINSETLRPMMDELKGMYKKAMKEDTPFKFGDLTDADKKALRKYLDNDVRSDLASVKRAALSYGDMMRNNAMLDYGRRYGFDNILGTVFPYQFWYTRSMMNWAKRMVDKPSWFAMYARMKQAQERMEQENMPTRLRGKMRINMPWMPEWMGGGLWTDPMSKIFPFEQFGQPFEQYAMNKNQLNKAAEYIVEDMRSSEKITAAEAEQAINTKQGTIWERALAQAEIEEGKSASPASLAGMMMQPALWWQIPLNMTNKNRDQIGPLPITRTGQTIKELGSNTFLQPLTNLIGGALAGPETAIRKSKGLSEFGQWGDYYIDRTIAGMAADGEITSDQARIAMIQRSGDVYDEAVKRVSQEQALRTPGAAGIMALKEGKPIQAIPAFIASIFGGSLFSEGEMKMRGLKPVYDNAWKKFEAGDDEAINQFFEDYPEYEARLALYDEPDQRLHQFLIDSIWRKYMNMDKENKRLAVDALGEDFELSFLNKETRSYETIDDKTLAKWSQMLGKSEMPNVAATTEAQTTKPISTYDQQMLNAINAYKTAKETQFKGINMWQEAYFNLPVGAQRKAFLKQYPQLKAYWDWKDEYAQAHPELAPYFQELQQSSTADQASSELTSPLIRQILTLATGGTLSAGAKNELERIRQQIAPEMSEEQFIQIVLALVLSQ